MSARTATTDDALTGVRVIELANFLAGPLAGMLLGDFGADVVKVERPAKGDECRYWGNDRDGVGLYFKVLNRNKRSITADLHAPLGQEIVRRLVEHADVVIENFRPGTLERWNLGYDDLSAVNPGLVMVRISAYGQTGPYRKRPGFGTLAEAFAGYAHITGEPDGPPLLPAFGLADATTGLMAAMLSLVALRARDDGGTGQFIDLGIYESLFALLGPQVIDFDQLGIVQARNGSRLPFTAPRNTFVTRDDRWIAIGGSAQSVFERICDALECPDVATRSEFLDNRLRIQNAAALDRELQNAVEKIDFDELMRRFVEIGAAAAPVQSVDQVIADPQVEARENVVTIEDDELGPIRMQNVVGKLSATPGRIGSAGPVLGSSNQEVLVGELGFDEDELRDGVVVMLPTSTRITEVGPRDGLQSHTEWVPTDVKVAMIDRLSACGFATIEATSFAHPEAVPHLRDAEQVLSAIARVPGTTYRALVPNERGARRAVDGGADAVLGLVTASETYNRENQNRPVDASVDEAIRAHAVAVDAGMPFTMAIGMAFYCPFEGPIDPERVLRIVDRLHDAGVRTFYFAGSLGVEDPVRVGNLIAVATATWSEADFGFHVHDLAGFGLVNSYAALSAGVAFLESSICGLGGGMHVPSGSSNVATEDLVHLLTLSGVDVRLDASELVDAARDVAQLLNVVPRSRVARTGVRSDLPPPAAREEASR